MTEKLKNITAELIDIYINILEQEGEPKEEYKYLAINTFQENWDLKAGDFHQMFKDSFSKVYNLMHQNSSDFIKKLAQNFPEETREMFRKLYDNSGDVAQRIKDFQAKSEELLPGLKEKLKKEKLTAQQDERTISVYLAFRYPEKYIIYKSDYYEKFCDILGTKPQETGKRFLHFQELANQIIEEEILNDEFINRYRKIYKKQVWDDRYLMIQNILYVVFRKDLKELDLTNFFKDFNRKDLEDYYDFLDKIIEKFDLQPNDPRLVFNFGSEGRITFTLGQRYVWLVRNSKSSGFKFGVISTEYLTENHSNYEGKPVAFWSKTNSISEIIPHQSKVFDAIESELKRTKTSSFSQFNKKYLVKMAFDKDFRKEILSQLDYQPTHAVSMEVTDKEKKTPLNQILFGAPGTGKTYNTKKIAVEIINGEKARTREEINAEYESLVDAKQILFTTFHQSLSYEDFIEGIKPEISDGNVTYEVKDGIFKQLVNQAKQIHSVKRSDINWEKVNFYKMSLGGKNNPLEHQYCITNNLGGISWGGNNDLKNLSNIKDWVKYRDTFIKYFPKVVEENRYNIQASFILNKMKIGDIVIATKGNRIIDSIGKVSGGYHYDEDNPTSLVHFRKIEWFLTDLNIAPDRFFKKQISQQSIYQFYIEDVKIEAFKELTSTSEKTKDKRFVLIIDEINRGNVSAIFGELITLLEEDKRKGNKEQTEVILPYSNDKFSVPNNVYIVGTMNTADRSVEALDTALRRRFSFMEMAPDPKILSDSEYRDVDLKRLLATINQRIEVLIDKDHQIGHSYFIGIQNLDDLKVVFRDQIIPLLEEYFYGDFGKIGLVLGGSLIYEKENAASFPKNFKYEHDFLEDKKIYRFTPFENWNESTFTSVYQD